MAAVIYAVIAMFFYAISNVMIERKIGHLHPLITMVFFYTLILAITGPIMIFRKNLGLNFSFPQTQDQYWILGFCALATLVADFCFFSAYHANGNLMTITTIAVLLPVFACLIKYFIGGGSPTTNQLLGWVLAAVSVFLVSRP